jgi:hypothetical protein
MTSLAASGLVRKEWNMRLFIILLPSGAISSSKCQIKSNPTMENCTAVRRNDQLNCLQSKKRVTRSSPQYGIEEHQQDQPGQVHQTNNEKK